MTNQFRVDQCKTAILLLDYQNQWLKSYSDEVQKEALGKANEILTKARLENITIIYVEVIPSERSPELEIHPAIFPKPGEIVLIKRSVGPFSTTNLEEILTRQDVDTLVLMGVGTSGCVLTTVRFAADMHYKLVVISDCCLDHDDEVQRVLMGKIFPRQASVITAKQFLQAMGKSSQ